MTGRRARNARTHQGHTTTEEGLLVWAYFFEPREATNPDGSPKMKAGKPILEYEGTVVFPASVSQEPLRALCRAAGSAEWGPDQTQWPGMDPMQRTFRQPFYPCNAQKDKTTNQLKPGMIPDGWYIKAKSTQPPAIVRRDLSKILNAEDVYWGCYGIMSVNCYTYGGPGTPHTPGIAFGLRGFQKMREGTPLGNRVDPEKEFKRFEPEAGSGAAAGFTTGAKLNPNDML